MSVAAPYLVPRALRANDGSDEITVWCPCCVERTVLGLFGVSRYPPKTLVVDRFSSRCGDCGKSANPFSETHDVILGYGSDNGSPGCDVRWENVTSDYVSPNVKQEVTNLRPDLRYIGWGAGESRRYPRRAWSAGVSAYLTVLQLAELERASQRVEREFAKLRADRPDAPLVYVVQRGDDGPVKIGHISRVDRLVRRLKEIQTGCAEPLVVRRLLVPAVPAREVEEMLHDWFAQYRLEGEWFEPSRHVMRFATGRG